MKDKANTRQVFTFRNDWRFSKLDIADAARPDYDDSQWPEVRVPHDWAIGGAFDRANDLMHTRIVQDGETRVSEHTGRTGGLPHVGIGWYRRRFAVPTAWADKRVLVEFDGVMSNSTIFLNGYEVGSWPYGYSSFALELTDRINWGSENLLAVRVDNKPQASRWYPGAGIYRHVRLVVHNPVHVAHWGTYITTPEVTQTSAQVRVRTEVRNQSDEAREVELVTTVLNPEGTEQARVTSLHRIPAQGTHAFSQQMSVHNPVLWGIVEPKLYQAVSSVRLNGEEVDRYETWFGIRTLRFDNNDGFFLNGRHLKLKGVCMHHDLGALGAAVNRRAIERQLEILKQMGCNAIRTSHNPPAPELLDLCDTMGFLVIDEAFDEWRVGKVANGYHTLFDAWAEKDLRAMIRRDRNHPCVIMWSIGNEIGDQRRGWGGEVARFLTNTCHDEDPTRPVTAGFNSSEDAIANGLADAVDIPAWNYKCHLYGQYHRQHPEWIMYGSETESCVSSRGEYYFPVRDERGVTRPSLHCTSYDLAAPPWGYPPDYEFAAQDDCPFILGQFTWTGFDYLGEPTPYKSEWPSRSSYFGIVDLCGIPKDRYYLYKSQWSCEPTLHLLPHWNWEGCEGELIPVHCYTNFPSAELFLNGRSLGVREKANPGEGAEKQDPNPGALGLPFTRYRLMWDNVAYEPGTLKVVAFNADGKPAMSQEVKTAGRPARIELIPDRQQIMADGEDLCFVMVRIVDAQGNLCPVAENRIGFQVRGAAEIAAVDNGDPTSLEPFQSDSHRAFHGRCVLIVRSVEQSGPVEIEAVSEGMEAGRVRIEAIG